MSSRVVEAVWNNAKADGVQLLILLAIADQANDDGIAEPTVGSIAKRCRISERYVQANIRRLVDDGQLRVEPGVGRYAPNTYAVTVSGVNRGEQSGVNRGEQSGVNRGELAEPPPPLIPPLSPAPLSPPYNPPSQAEFISNARAGAREEPPTTHTWRPSPELERYAKEELGFSPRRFDDEVEAYIEHYGVQLGDSLSFRVNEPRLRRWLNKSAEWNPPPKKKYAEMTRKEQEKAFFKALP